MIHKIPPMLMERIEKDYIRTVEDIFKHSKYGEKDIIVELYKHDIFSYSITVIKIDIYQYYIYFSYDITINNYIRHLKQIIDMLIEPKNFKIDSDIMLDPELYKEFFEFYKKMTRCNNE